MLTLLALALFPTGGTPTESPLVLRSYDISSAIPWRGATRTGETLFPQLIGNAMESSNGGWVGGEENSGAELLIEMLQHIYKSEFEQVDRSLQIDEHEHLIVRAPEEVQQGVLKLLTFWEGAFNSPTELALDVVLSGSPGLSAPSSLMTAADADKLLASTGNGARRSSQRLRIRPGSTGTIDLTTTTELVTDYDCEIAQATAILSPIVESIRTGMRVEARCAPAPGGLWLALVQRASEPIGEVREEELHINSQITTQNTVQESAMARRIQALDIENRSFALNAFLPEGKVLVVQTSVNLQGRQGSQLVFIRALGKAPQRDLKLTLEGLGARGEIAAHQWQYSMPPRLHAMLGDSFFGSDEIFGWMRGGETDKALVCEFQQDGVDRLLEEISGDTDLRLEWTPWAIVRRDPNSDAGGSSKAEERALALSRLAPSPRIIQVSLVLKRTGTQPGTVARGVLPVRLGEQGAIAIGTEAERLASYNVEVAQEACVADPVVCDSFDGLCCIVRPEASLQGELTLKLSGLARIQRGAARQFNPQSPSIGPMWQASFDQLQLRENLVFPKENTGPRTIALGDPTGGSGPGALVLEVELSEIR